MKVFLNISILFFVLANSVLFAQEEKPLKTYGETFAVQAYITEDFAKKTTLTERAATSTAKLRLRRNGVPYDSLENSIGTLEIYVAAIEVENTDGESMDSYAFSLTIMFKRWLQDENSQELYAGVYFNDYIGYAGTDTAKDFVTDGINDLIDQFSISFLEQNDL